MAVKKAYEAPETKLLRFETEDVIAKSNDLPGGEESSGGNWWEW